MSLNARTHRYTVADVPPFFQPPADTALTEDELPADAMPDAMREALGTGEDWANPAGAARLPPRRPS